MGAFMLLNVNWCDVEKY